MIKLKGCCFHWERDNISRLHRAAACGELRDLLRASQPCKSFAPFFSSDSPLGITEYWVPKYDLFNYTLVPHLSLQSHVVPLCLAVPWSSRKTLRAFFSRRILPLNFTERRRCFYRIVTFRLILLPFLKTGLKLDSLPPSAAFSTYCVLFPNSQ